MEQEYNPDLFTLSDDEGNEFTFEVLDAIEDDSGRYVAMLPVFDHPEDEVEDSGSLVIMKEVQDGDESFFEEIEEEEEFNRVADIFVNRLQDTFDFEAPEEV